jgi:phosphate-selective porin OprO/OprP
VDPTYNGWYVDASLFLTGETRRYASDEGIFDRVKVKNPVIGGGKGGGWGAWQIAGRYDVIDLRDKNNVLVGFNSDGDIVPCSFCGEQSTWLIGVNWYWNDYTRFMLNVTQSEIKGGNGGNPPTAGFNRNNGAETTGVGLRAQIDW